MRRSDRNPISTHNGYVKLKNGLFNQILFEMPDSEFTFLDTNNIADYEFQEDAGVYRQMRERQEPFRPLTANLIEEFSIDVSENRVERQPVLHTGPRGMDELNRALLREMQRYAMVANSIPSREEITSSIGATTILYGTPGEVIRETVPTENMSTEQIIEYFDRISQDE